MRSFHLFYSWQSDGPAPVCRNFIQEALKAAAKTIRETRLIDVTIDADTQGVSGTPSVSETILAKIDACDGFLADLTLVASTPGGKASPNPNVLIEYGYALRAKGPHHIILAMNTAFGGPDALPFDLRHLRHPMKFAADPAITDADRRTRRSRFAEQLVVAINGVIDRVPPRKEATGKTVDPEIRARKDLDQMTGRRLSAGPATHMLCARALIEIVSLGLIDASRLTPREVKATRTWFKPSDESAAEVETSHGQWISRDPRISVGRFPNMVSRWSTRLFATGQIERAIALGDPSWDDFEQTIDGDELDRRILNAVVRSGEIYSALGLDAPVVVGMMIERGHELRLSHSGVESGKLGLPSIRFRAVRVDNPRNPASSQLRPLLDELWQAAGFEDGTPSISDEGWTITVPKEGVAPAERQEET